MAIMLAFATSAICAGSVYSNILYANQYADFTIGYSYSVVGELLKWITTTQEDFECSGPSNRFHVDTRSSPGDVILEKTPAWAHWWNSSWQYRMLINVEENSNSNLTNYQVPIILNPKTFNYSKANVDGSDIRFTFYNSSNNNETELSYWIEKWNISNESKIWVNVKRIPAGGTSTIYMYYGNPTANSTSNGTATFMFFDDFEDSLAWWENGLWHTTSKKWNSENHSKWYGQEATDNYDTGTANSGSLISPEFQGNISARLEVWFWREVENLGWVGYDQTIIYDSQDNSTWNQLWYNDSGDASESRWKFLSIQMTANARYIRFYFDTIDEYYNDYWGWFIDDVKVRKYVSPEPTVNMGAEESQQSWIDYFGGTASIESLINVSVSDGDVKIGEYEENQIAFSDSFETDLTKWDDNYATLWYLSTDQQYDGSQSVKADRINDGALVSDDIDLSDATSAYLDFWFRKDDIESTDFRLYFYNGSSYNLISYLDTFGRDDIWLHYNSPINLTIYNISNFRIAFYAVLGWGENVWVDQLVLTKTVSKYYSSGNVTSITISPLNLAGWDEFYARSTIPQGTNITYKILNATNNAVVCTITAGQASTGYDISSYTTGVESIKLYAELMANASSIPILHDWGISWHSSYYENGYLISCFHDAGNATNYYNISWNATLPNGTTIKFQIASSPDNITWTEFLGPDGNNSTYYNISGTSIWIGHDGNRYIKYKAYFETTDSSKTPILHDVTIVYGG